MNRRNFLKASAYTGIAIITTPNVLMPVKKIITPFINFDVAGAEGDVLVVGRYGRTQFFETYLTAWAEVYGIPNRYIRGDTVEQLQKRIIHQVENVGRRKPW